MNGIRLTHAPSTALKSTGNGSAASLPSRIKLLNWGVNKTTEGDILVDDLTVKLFAMNQKAIGRDRVQMDFEHNTVPGSPEHKRTQEPRPVAAHSNLVVVPGEGIFAEGITYTATGQKHAADYEDVSLTPWIDKQGRVIAAHSFALTHTGAATGMNFAQAPETLSAFPELAADLKTLSAGTSAPAQPPTQTQPMDKFVSLAALAGLVGLSADADEGAVMIKLKTSLTPAAAVDLAPLSTRLKVLEDKAPAGTDLAPLTARIDKLEKLITDGQTASTTEARARLITLMASEGKAPVNPATGKAYTAEELNALDLPVLQILQANTAVTVPLSARNTHLTENARNKFRVKDHTGKEVVDMAALLEAENEAVNA